jgi:hypothetical protein
LRSVFDLPIELAILAASPIDPERTASVLDDKSLMQRTLQHIGFEAGQGVGGCPRREGHHNGHRPVGIFVGADRKRRQAAQRTTQEHDMEKSAAGGGRRRSCRRYFSANDCESCIR